MTAERTPATIRAAIADDAMALATLRLTALREAPDAFGATYADGVLRSEDDWRGWAAGATTPPNAMLVADHAGGIVGMCGVAPARDAADAGLLWGMFVMAAHRGTTVARELVERAEQHVASHGRYRVIAGVSEGNARAIAFYRKLGYTIHPPSHPLRPGSTIMTHPIEKALR